MRSLSLLGLAAIAGATNASAQVATSLVFEPADPDRTYMDVGGTWNGASDVSLSGDRFAVSISNGADGGTVHDLVYTASLPTGFVERTGTLNLLLAGAGCSGTPTASVSRLNDDLTFDFGGFDLAPGCALSFDYGLLTANTTGSGTYGVGGRVEGSSTDGGATDVTESASTTIVVRAGDAIVGKDPAVTIATVNSGVTWTVSVTNSGLGGLFDVTLDESAIGAGLTLDDFRPTGPVSPPPTTGAGAVSIPYLAPGETLSAEVDATVAQCTDLVNVVSMSERTGQVTGVADATIQLDLLTPFIETSETSADIALGGTGSITIDIDNTGDGVARGLAIDTDLESRPLDVVSVSSGWTYDPVTGIARTTTPLAPATSAQLVITVSDPDTVCTVPGRVGFSYTTRFEDDCGTPFATPAQIGSIGSEDAPGLVLGVSGPERLSLGEAASLVLTASVSNGDNLQNAPVIVTYELPGGIQSGATFNPTAGTVSCAGSCGAGDTLTWTIPRADIVAGAEQLTIDFNASTDACDAGEAYDSVGSIASAHSAGTCSVSNTGENEFILTNEPRGLELQSFNTNGEPFETGTVDNGDGTRVEGEGEEARFEAEFTFPETETGVWIGSEYSDDFGGLSAVVLTQSSLEYQLNSGAWTAVPGSALALDASGFTLALDFLDAVDGDGSAQDDTLRFRYTATAPDSVLGGGSSIQVEQYSTLRLASGIASSAACTVGGGGAAVYTLGDFVTWRRAAGNVSVALSSSVIDVCETVDATISVSNELDGTPIRNLLASLGLGSDFDLVTPSVPAYAGALGGGASVTYNDGAPGGSTVLLNDPVLSGSGSVTIPIQRKATASNQGGGVTARIDYDDNQTAPAGGQSFSSTAATAPELVRVADLEIFVTPTSVPIATDQAEWLLTVINTGSGTAFATEVSDVLPAGLTITPANLAAMDALNSGMNATGGGSTVAFGVGDLPPGGSVDLAVIATVDGSTCIIPPGSNAVTAQWGCGGVISQSRVSTRPDLSFPDDNLQVLHDTTGAFASLCGTGQIVLIVRNAGASEVVDVVIDEALNTASTGISLNPGTVEYSVDGGATWAPAGAVANASTLQFNRTNIPPLDVLGPFGSPTGEVLIRFGILTDARTNADQTVSVAAGGALHCGDPANSPGAAFDVPLDRPVMRVVKTGRNQTTGTALADTVYGRPGDTIEWQVAVTNAGQQATNQLRIRDLLSGSGGSATLSGGGLSGVTVTSDYIDINEIAAGATEVFTITEVLGSTCANGNNIADVTWGCAPQMAGAASELSNPADNEDDAALVMRPAAVDIDLSVAMTAPGETGAPVMNGEVTVVFTNSGAPFTEADLAVELPAGYVVDTSVAPSLTNTDGTADRVTTVTVDPTTPATPILTLGDGVGGDWVRHGATITVTLPVVATGQSDTASDGDVRTETPANGNDPDPLASGTVRATLDFESSCGDPGTTAASAAVAPKTPDLDIDIAEPLARIVSGTGDTTAIDVVVTNNGDTLADHAQVSIVTGNGWSGAAPMGCTGSIPGTLVCDLSGAAALGMGASRTFTLDLTVDNETSPLSVSATVEGNIEDASGTDTGIDYSLDAIVARVLGFRQTLDLQSTSEADFDAVGDVQIGEDAVLRVTSFWFGGGTETISDVSVDLDFEANNRFAFIGDSVGAGPNYTSRTLAAGTTGLQQRYDLPDFTGGQTSIIDIAVRALDVAANPSGASLDFVSESSSVFLGSTFDASASNYPGPADRTEALVTERPVLAIEKSIRNETQSGSFDETAQGDASDVIEFQLVVSNTGTAPAFDLDITDTLPAGLTLVDMSTDGLDNDGDGSAADGAEGGVSGQTLTFNTAESGPGQFDVLAAGGTVTLLYRATADATVNPNEALENNASADADTLAGPNGGQGAPTGSKGDPLGAAELTASDAATLIIDAVDLVKSLVVTSVAGDDSTDVVVGEQADFQLQIVLPAGTVEDFIVEDALPDGLALISRAAPVFGADVSCTASATGPASLPATGPSLVAQWDFDTCTVGDAPAANRTVTLSYTTQVVNAAAVDNGVTLPNQASYDHSRTGDPVAIAPVTLTVREPQLNLSLDLAPGTNVDAGDPLTYTYTLSNTGAAPAFDVDLFSLLNDNSAAAGGDGDVNTSAAFGTALRDVVVIDCANGVGDGSPATGDFAFSFDNGNADGDGTDEADDCATLYRNISTDGFAAGASIVFTMNATSDLDIILRSTLAAEGRLSGTSLPVGAPGQGDPAYERSAASDPSAGNRYEAVASDTIVTRSPPSTQKTFTDTSDDNTAPDSGNAINVAIGETYTARVTYRFDEGTSRDAILRERVRVQNANAPGELELLAARLERSATGLTAADDPAGINAAAVNTPVDVTSLVSTRQAGANTFFDLAMGDIVSTGAGASPSSGRTISHYVVEYDMRVRDVASNHAGAFLDDLGQTRIRNAENTRLNTGGQSRRATIVEPDIAVTKTSADADGLLGGGETVRYTITARNSGTGPAYNTVLQDVLPDALRANGVSPVSILINGGASSVAPSFTYNPTTGTAQWRLADADVLLPGDDITIVYDATADAVVAPGTTHTNTFEVTAFFSQASSEPNERRQLPRSPQATVTLGAPEIAFYPDRRESTQPGSTIIYPHLLDIPSSLAGASLDFSAASSRNLGWEVWYDSDGTGTLSGGDTLWVNGTPTLTGDALQFFVRSQIPTEAQDGYRDATTFTATVTQGGTVLTETVTDITTVSRLQAGELVAGKFMAIDRDCDGSLSDEIPTDAAFEITKGAEPGDCIVFRITYRNTGTGDVSQVDVRDEVPAYSVYLGGTAAYESTPAGLTTGTIVEPAVGGRGPLSFPYTGTVEPGGEGSVVYGVRLDE